MCTIGVATQPSWFRDWDVYIYNVFYNCSAHSDVTESQQQEVSDMNLSTEYSHADVILHHQSSETNNIYEEIPGKLWRQIMYSYFRNGSNHDITETFLSMIHIKAKLSEHMLSLLIKIRKCVSVCVFVCVCSRLSRPFVIQLKYHLAQSCF